MTWNHQKRPSGMPRPIVLFFLTAFTLCWSPLFGAETVQSSEVVASETFPGKVSERIRYIPFTDLKEAFGESPKGLLISRDWYEALKQSKDAYLAAKPQSPMPKIDLDFCFSHATYHGDVRGNNAEFEASYHFDLPNERWVLLPLPSGDIGVQEVLLDGKPAGVVTESFSGIQDEEAPKGKVAVLQQRVAITGSVRKGVFSPKGRQGRSNEFLIALKGPGRHSVKMRFIVPMLDDPAKNELNFRIPRVPFNNFTVSLDQPGQFGEADRSEGTLSSESSGKGTQVSGCLGPTDRFTLRWAPKTASAEPKPLPPDVASEPLDTTTPVLQPKVALEPSRVFSDSFTLMSFGEGYIRTESLIRLNITKSPKGEIVFGLPKGTELIDVRSDRLDSQRVENLATTSRVVCRLNSQVQAQIDFLLVCETKMTDTSQKMSAPIHWVEDVERDRGFIGLEARTSIEIRRCDPETGEHDRLDISPVDISELPAEVTNRAIRPLVLAYRYNAPPVSEPLNIDILRHQDIPVLTSAIDIISAESVFTTEGTMISRLSFQVKNNGQQYLEARLASGSEIISTTLEGNPVEPQMKRDSKGEGTAVLVPLSRSRKSGDALGAFSLEIMYRSFVPKANYWHETDFALPTFDIPVSRLEWTIYAPDDYSLLPLQSELDKPIRSIYFPPFLVLSALFSLLLTPGVLIAVVIAAFLYFAYKRMAAVDSASDLTWSVVRTGFVIVVLIAVLGSVAGPMVGSITDQARSGHHVSSMFGSINSKLSSSHSQVYPSAPSAPSSRSEGGYAQSMPQEMDSEERDERSQDGAAMGDKLSAKNEMMTEKKKMAGPMAAGGKGDPSQHAFQAARRNKAGRDVGALPVDMRLPKTGSSLFMFRNIVRSFEKTAFRGILLWEPLHLVLALIMGCLGLLVFAFVYLCACWNIPFMAAIIFLGFSAGIQITEEILPGSQNPALSIFFLALGLVFVTRLWGYFRSRKTPAAVAVVLLLLALFPGSPVSAKGADFDPRVEKIIDIFLPYTQLQDRLPKDSNLVYLSMEDFKYLRDLGLPEPEPGKLIPPVGVTYLSGTFDGTVLEDRVELKARFEVELLGKGYKQILFPTDRIGVKSLLLNGEPTMLSNRQIVPGIDQQQDESQARNNNVAQMAVQQQAIMNQMPMNNFSGYSGGRSAIITDKEGKAVIEAVLVKDLFSKNDPKSPVEGFDLPLPRFALSQMRLFIPRRGQFVDVTPSAMVKFEETATGTQMTAVLQPADTLKVEWRAKVEEKPVPPPEVQATETVIVPEVPKEAKVFVDHQVLFSISEGVIGITDFVRLEVKQNPVGEFVFTVPAGLEVNEVSGSDLAGWVCRKTDNGQEIRITLNAKRLQAFDFRIEMERPIPQINGEFALDIPEMVSMSPAVVIERQKGYFGIESREGLQTNMVKTEPATTVDPQELPAVLKNSVQGFLAFAYKFLKIPQLAVKVTKHQSVELPTAQIDGASARTLITREGKILTQLDLVVRNNNNQFLLLDSLGSNTRILSVLVNGDPVKPGIGGPGEIYVPLIRSAKSGKSYLPFGVSLIFEEVGVPFTSWGGFKLCLPSLSLDISEMNWRVDAQEGFVMVKGKGEFRLGAGNIPPLPGRSFSDESKMPMSNVMTQSIMNTRGDASEGRSSTAGFLPVDFQIPMTSNVMVFNKKLIVTKSEPPELRIFYARETLLRIVCLVLALFVAVVVSVVLRALTCGGCWTAAFGTGGILTLGALNLVGLSFLPEYYSILARLMDHLIYGLEMGLTLPLIWMTLTGELCVIGSCCKTSEDEKLPPPAKPPAEPEKQG